MLQITSKSHFTVAPEPTRKIGRSERANAEIQNAAVKFLWSRPFREVTVEKLMEQTSLGRSAFYYHFTDLHELMEAILGRLEAEIMEGASPWFTDDGDPVALLHASLAAEVRTCFRLGPILKAVRDAAGSDARLEAAWKGFLDRFNDTVRERIEADQVLGLIEPFDPGLVAASLNHADASLYIHVFGQRPRRLPGPVLDTVSRLWISTLYGRQWVESRASTLVREEISS